MTKRTLELSIIGRSGAVGIEGEDDNQRKDVSGLPIKISILLAPTYISGFDIALETFFVFSSDQAST